MTNMKRAAFVLPVISMLMFLFAPPAGAVPYGLDSLSTGCTSPGSTVVAHVNGFLPNASVAVQLVGTTGIALGTLVADEVGVVEGPVTIPSVAAGDYSVTTIGTSSNGGVRTVTFGLKVAANPAAACASSPAIKTQVLGGTVSPGGKLPGTGANSTSFMTVGFGFVVLGLAGVLGGRYGRARRRIRLV